MLGKISRKIFSSVMSMLLVISLFAPNVQAESEAELQQKELGKGNQEHELAQQVDIEANDLSEELLTEQVEQPVASVDTILQNVFSFYENGRQNKEYFQWGIPELNWTEIVALDAVGKYLHEETTVLPDWVENEPYLPENNRGTEHIRYIFGLLALDKDPSAAWETKRNLFAELAAQQKEADGSIGAVNKHMWAMLALDTGERLGYPVGTWDENAKTKALQFLLSQELEGGGFAFYGTKVDPDMTGMALLPLANYQDESAAVEAINRAKQVLLTIQLDTAGWAAFNTENSNSIATVVSGLVAIGEDISSEKWTKNGLTPLDALGTFQLPNGAFTYTKDHLLTNMMATEQSLIALQEIKTGKSVWYQFTNPANPTEPEDPTHEPIVVGGEEYTLPTYEHVDVEKPIVLQINQAILPKITAERAGATLEIDGETVVTSSDWDRLLQVPTKKATTQEEHDKISNDINGTLESIHAHIKVGGEKSIVFDRHVTLRMAGFGNKEAGFIDTTGRFAEISKMSPDSQLDVFSYKEGDDLVIKTKHFTQFVVYEKSEPSPSVPPTSPSTVTFSVEKRTMGQGDIISSTTAAIQPGDTAYTVLKRVAEERSIAIRATGDGPTLYVQSIDGLAEFDGGPQSGWMYSVNGIFPEFSAGIYKLKDGDVLRWQYTKNLGEDLGHSWNPPDNTEPNKPGDNTTSPQLPDDVAKQISTSIKDTQQKLLKDGVKSDWEAIGLFQSGISVPKSYVKTFYQQVQDQIISKSGKGRMKITDVERLVMTAGVLGIDPTNVDGKGFNLLDKIYNSETRITGEDSLTFQGNNGVIFALIALDSKNYEIPKDAKWTREKLVAQLLKTQKDNGSWSLETSKEGSTSIDITAMALTALAPYRKQPEVKKAIDNSVAFLSKAQGSTGGYDEAFVGGVTSEATAQVIIGLTANGIDPRSEQFTKGQTNLIDHLLGFKSSDGGFKHVADDKTSNAIATEQALQALVAYDLYNKGKGRLYNFGQVTIQPTPTPFTDVKGHWAADYIQQASGLGIINGYKDGTFRPSETLTRTQTVSILVRALDLKTDKNSPFSDTKNYTDEVQADIAAAYHNGLIKGVGGKFKPTDEITRAEMALLFYRAYEIQNGETYKGNSNAPFTDMKYSTNELQAAVSMLYDFKMAVGVNGQYMPTDYASRAHGTKMLVQFLQAQ